MNQMGFEAPPFLRVVAFEAGGGTVGQFCIEICRPLYVFKRLPTFGHPLHYPLHFGHPLYMVLLK